ncbi:MAG: DMT family transporter [Hyphomicrobiaceae bacterium]|nr:MAG: DMT family transporter [Hyphomicrobiaceae bacterium]
MLAALKYLGDGLYRWPSLLLTLTAVFWAGNTIAGRLAVGHISPLMLVSIRWVLVVSALWPIYGGQVLAHWSEIRPKLVSVLLMAAAGFTGFNVLYYLAAHTTTAVNMGILQGGMPIFVLAGAFLWHGSRASRVQVTGVLITLAGVVVVATRGAPLAILEIGLNGGDVLVLAACVLYASYTVALHDRPSMPGAAFFTLLALIAAATSLPLVAFEAATRGLETPSLQGFIVAAYVAIFPSCLAQLFFLRGVDLLGPGRAGVFVNLVPIFSAILAVTLLGEPFAAFHAVALLLVIGGIWLAERGRGT